MVREIHEVIAAHEARNRELVALIARKGGDLQVARTIDLHFWANDAAHAEALARELRDAGLTNVVARVSRKDDAVWNVEGQVARSVQQVVDPKFVERFAVIAASHGANFDGWGTPL